MKNFFLIVLATVVFASCTESETPDLLTPAVPQSTDTPSSTDPSSRAINDIFKLETIGDFNYWETQRVDFQGNLYGEYSGLCYNLSQKELRSFDFYTISYFLSANNLQKVDWCIDNKGNIIVAANDSNGYGHVYMYTPDLNSRIDLTLYFPELYIHGVCVAENGNIFVGGNGKIYRLNISNGVLKEVASGIEYVKLMKMKGAFIGGQCEDGRLFKANTTTGEIEYITPRVNGSYTTASNMPNFYVIDNFRIIEIRPNNATDIVIGTIPISSTDQYGKNISFDEWWPAFWRISANADATIFYAGSFKLTLK